MSILICSSLVIAQDGSHLKRFPDICGDQVIFVSGDDIWIASIKGGLATRLTDNDGAERFPKFSADGKLIAFTGEYDGNADVYVMNTFGGNITRLTYHPGYDEVVGWHPVKNKIIFQSRRKSFGGFSRLYLVSPDGTGLEEIPIHEIAYGSFSPDGQKIAFNRVAREHRTWKRYKGGTAQEIYIYDFKTKREKNVTNFKGTDRSPMWIGNKVYFVSDRDQTLNVYVYDTVSGKTEQLTSHKEYDVRRASKGKNNIVYEVAGEIYNLDLQSKKTAKIDIQIRSDAPEVRPYIKAVDKEVNGLHVSPTGKRALVMARGEIFSVPKKYGPTNNLTNTSGAREKDGVWSPDGKKIAYLSDAGGEYQVYVKEASSPKAAVKLTNFKDGYRHTLKWSPDGEKIGFTDQKLRLFYITIADKNIVEVDQAEYENIDVSLDLKPIFDYSWSPDSRWLAYVKMNKQSVYQIYIYSLESKKKQRVSQELFNDSNPVFSTDGHFLYFISNRRFSPTYCDLEWEMVYKDIAGIYSLKLMPGGEPRFPYRNDIESEKKKKEKEKVIVNIDFKGIQDRIEPFPLKRGNYRNLSTTDDGIFYLNKEKGDFNKFEFRIPRSMTLYNFSFKKRQESTVVKNINFYKLSHDGSTIIYKMGNNVGMTASSEKNSKGSNINLSGLKMRFNPKEEWWQIFNEAWRMERDFYYEPNMHGLDWQAMKKKYSLLMDKAVCRQDIRFIIGELIGELNTSHTYIFGGDRKRTAKRVNVGLLGADWKVDSNANRYQFDRIYKVSEYNANRIPPLARPEINIQSGDYLLQVNGMEVKTDRNIYSYFVDLAGKQVTITVNSKPSIIGARRYVVKPISSESRFRYLDWVEANRLAVDKASNGTIGYLHFPDTYNGSAGMFPKYFYSQTRKEGLIVDGRFNGGGLDPEIFLRRLNRKPHSYWTRRYSDDQQSPNYGVTAHMVCLTNRQAGSGGDEFPFEFRQFGMGPVIGTRTWGGLVGVSMFIELIDGGGLTAPDYRIYHTDGSWIVENKGVAPDIEVFLHPEEMFSGKDAQLEKGVEYLLKKIKEKPFARPEHGTFPAQKLNK
jgi:tricorn protease